jgi:transcriptional regulator with XRE-family HTH domain
MESQNTFGRLLEHVRKDKGWSRPQLAVRAELDPSHVYRLEKGKRLPGRETVLKLAEVLGLDDETLDRWLVAANYAPTRDPVRTRGAVRTRGVVRTRSASEIPREPGHEERPVRTRGSFRTYPSRERAVMRTRIRLPRPDGWRFSASTTRRCPRSSICSIAARILCGTMP